MPRATDPTAGEPTVSVVIAAYNAAPFIERAIRSALEQTLPVAEIIVVDDCSTDATVQMVENIGRQDDRVKLLTLPANGGPSEARNAGFAAASGEWIAVLDADDAYLPDRLAHLMPKSGDADILADNLLSYDPEKDAASTFPGPTEYGWEQIDLPTFADARRKHRDFGLFKPVFRRSFLEEHKLRYPEDVRHGEDFLFVFEAIARGGRYWLNWQPGYLYTMRNSGWSRTQVDYRAMGRNLEELAKRRDLDLPVAVQEKLADRAAYTRNLHARQELRDAFQQGRLLRVLGLASRNPRLWPMIGRNLHRVLFKA